MTVAGSGPAHGSSGADGRTKTPFAASLRARSETIRVGEGGGWMVRAQLAEVWDTVRLDVDPSVPVSVVRERALEVLLPDAGIGELFVVKLNGMEVLNEHASIAEAGAVNGSTFLITYRRRRPVR